MEWEDGKVRCQWVNPKNEKYIRYHDNEWGVPVYDDHKLFEMLILESFQAGLSWECVLNKRENFRKAFDGFDLEKVCRYDEALDRREGSIRSGTGKLRAFRPDLCGSEKARHEIRGNDDYLCLSAGGRSDILP